MFGFSGEHLLIVLIVLLIFGPRRLPDLGHSIGRTLKNFKDGMSGLDGSSPTASQNPAPAPRIEERAPETGAPKAASEQIAKEQVEKV